MGGTCSTYRRTEKCIQCNVRKREKRDHLEDIGVDGKVILKWILKEQDYRAWSVVDSPGIEYGQVSGLL
jgi:hypothetical protein